MIAIRVASALFSLVLGLLFLSPPSTIFAASAGAAGGEGSNHLAMVFLAIAGILVGAKIFHLIEKIKQPPVVGELVAGIVLGNLALFGFPFFAEMATDEIIRFLAEFGVIILLFQIGLESNVGQLLKVGKTSLFVALIGAFLPFVLGAYLVGPVLIPGQPQITYLFLGASLAATSVGITARIFRDLGKLRSQPAQVVLGAAVIDDILGLVMLAVISAIAAGGSVTPITVGFVVLKSFLFLALSIVIGQLIAPSLSKVFSKIHTGVGSKFTLAISFGLVFAAFASLLGLEPIIGAFAAGLVLDPVHFKGFREPHLVEEIRGKLAILSPKASTKLNSILTHHSEKSIEDVIEPLAFFFVPIFFVVTGMSVDVLDLLNPRTIVLAVLISIVAVIGKVIAGLPAAKGSRLVVGFAMVPRGEVGLIFASIGQNLGVISGEFFSVIVLTVLMTTVVGPLFLTNALRKAQI